MAQALVIGRVDKQCPIALVILDVVHIGGPNPPALTSTFPAKRFPQKLGGPEVIRPNRQAVPVVPGCTLTADRWLGFVSRAPAVSGQSRAAWVPTGSQ